MILKGDIVAIRQLGADLFGQVVEVQPNGYAVRLLDAHPDDPLKWVRSNKLMRLCAELKTPIMIPDPVWLRSQRRFRLPPLHQRIADARSRGRKAITKALTNLSDKALAVLVEEVLN